jgi:hypothetical protein
LTEKTARGRAMRTRKVARIFTHNAGLFANYQKMKNGYGVLLEMSFSLFFYKSRMEKGYGVLLEMLYSYRTLQLYLAY